MNANNSSFSVVEKGCVRLGKGEVLIFEMPYRYSQHEKIGSTVIHSGVVMPGTVTKTACIPPSWEMPSGQ